MGVQYTIRAVPPEVDLALRRKAEREGKSLNAVTLEILAEGLDLEEIKVEYRDLDELIGVWRDDPAYDAAVAEFEQIDEKAWK